MRWVEFLTILGMMLVTFSIRALLLVFSDRFRLTGNWERALVYVPPAVLSAITVPALLMPSGSMDFSLDNIYLLSGLAAIIAGVSLRRYALWAAIISGLSIFLLLRLLG